MIINPEMKDHNFFQLRTEFPKRCPHCNKKHKVKQHIHTQVTTTEGGVLHQFVPIYVCDKKNKPQVMIGQHAIVMQMVGEYWLSELDEYPSIQ